MQNYVTLLSLAFFVLIQSNIYPMSRDAEVVPFKQERDLTAIKEILKNETDRTYESIDYHGATTHVIRVNDKTIGFVSYIVINHTFLTFRVCHYGLVHLFGIDKEYHRKGFGTLLLKHTIEELKKLKVPSVFLMVKADNIAARTLYEKEGFVCKFASPEAQAKLVNMPMPYTKKLDIPADELPKGNIIQQYPKTSLAIGALSLGTLAYYKYKK